MDAYEKNVYYANQGDPCAQKNLVYGCLYGDEDEGYRINSSESAFWATKLKESAASGNILAQMEVCNSIPASLCISETEDDIKGLQKRYRNNIMLKANTGAPDAMFAKAFLLDNELSYDVVEQQVLGLLTSVAESRNSRACLELYNYYYSGTWGRLWNHCYNSGGNLPWEEWEKIFKQKKNLERALYYLQKGVECGDAYACHCQYELAKYYLYEGGDFQQYRYWLHVAAVNGSCEAMKEDNEANIRSEKQLFDVQFRNNGQSPTVNQSEGCYVATCVYGSYDCPQVWVLRRFRDFVLRKTWYGRMSVNLYYYVSPKVVHIFGEQLWFHVLSQRLLDRMVDRLKEKGFLDVPYND